MQKIGIILSEYKSETGIQKRDKTIWDAGGIEKRFHEKMMPNTIFGGWREFAQVDERKLVRRVHRERGLTRMKRV